MGGEQGVDPLSVIRDGAPDDVIIRLTKQTHYAPDQYRFVKSDMSWVDTKAMFNPCTVAYYVLKGNGDHLQGCKHSNGNGKYYAAFVDDQNWFRSHGLMSVVNLMWNIQRKRVSSREMMVIAGQDVPALHIVDKAEPVKSDVVATSDRDDGDKCDEIDNSISDETAIGIYWDHYLDIGDVEKVESDKERAEYGRKFSASDKRKKAGRAKNCTCLHS